MRTLTQLNRGVRVARNISWPVDPSKPENRLGRFIRLNGDARMYTGASHLYFPYEAWPNIHKHVRQRNRREVFSIILNLAYVAAAAGALGGLIVGCVQFVQRYWPLS